MRKHYLGVLLAVMLLSGAMPAGAQSALGTITGIVTDPSGAAVVGLESKW